MLGYNYEIIYRKLEDNVIVDALCQYEDEASLLALSTPILDWSEESFQEWLWDPSTAYLINKI